MQDNTLLTRAALVRDTDYSSANFPTRAATNTRPSGAGVIDRTGGGNVFGGGSPATLVLIPFGTGVNDQTFKVKVLGWQYIQTAAGGAPTSLWVPTLICQATCTMSSSIAGLANYVIDDVHYFCDGISVTNGSAKATDPVANTQAAILAASIASYPIVEVVFDLNSSATAANALWFYSTDDNFTQTLAGAVHA